MGGILFLSLFSLLMTVLFWMIDLIFHPVRSTLSVWPPVEYIELRLSATVLCRDLEFQRSGANRGVLNDLKGVETQAPERYSGRPTLSYPSPQHFLEFVLRYDIYEDARSSHRVETG